jgi:hypothetical protein
MVTRVTNTSCLCNAYGDNYERKLHIMSKKTRLPPSDQALHSQGAEGQQEICCPEQNCLVWRLLSRLRLRTVEPSYCQGSLLLVTLAIYLGMHIRKVMTCCFLCHEACTRPLCFVVCVLPSVLTTQSSATSS